MRTLVGAHLLFNLAFYLVVPFLAQHLRGDVGLSGWAVGLVLGLRTFAQQGLFVVGGVLADRCGVRALVVAGCVVRVVGYLALGTASSLPAAILGAVLTGFGGALFSPGLDALAARIGGRTEAAGGRTRLRLFALLAVAAETGAVLGPLLGAVLTGRSFWFVSVLGATLFAAAALVLALTLSSDDGWHAPSDPERPVAPAPSLAPVLRDHGFLLFAAAHAGYLLCYNQLYLALPVEVERSGGGASDVGVLFALASVATVLGQLPMARLAQRVGTRAALVLGFAVLALAFAGPAVAAPRPAGESWSRLLPAAGWVVLLTAGQMLLVPAAKAVVPRFAHPRMLGAYYGMLATTGGVAVLLGSLGLGALFELARTANPWAWVPWSVLTVIPLASALAMLGLPGMLRRSATSRASRLQDCAALARNDNHFQ